MSAESKRGGGPSFWVATVAGLVAVLLGFTARADMGNTGSYGSIGGSAGGGATNGIQMLGGSGTNNTLMTPTIINATFTGGVLGLSGSGAALTNLAAGNVVFYGYNTNILLLTGFGASYTTVTNDHAGTYINGPVINASGANGSYYWNASTQSYTNGAGYGVYYESLTTTATWLTNATYKLTLTAGAGSGIGALAVSPPHYYQSAWLGGWLQGDLSTYYSAALSDFQLGGSGAAITFQAFSNITASAASLSTNVALPQLQQSNVLNGMFTGNLAGSTNLPGTNLVSYSLTTTQMDNTTLLGWLCGNMGAYSNWNRFGTSNTFYNLSHRQRVTLLIDGTGLTSEPQSSTLLDSIFYNLTNYVPLAGYIMAPQTPNAGQSSYGPLVVHNTSTVGGGGNSGLSTDTTFWYGYNQTLTNSGAGVAFSLANNFAADTFEVDWVTRPSGGSFTIWTNGVSMTTQSGNGSGTGQLYRWTNSGPAAMTIGITNAASGTNSVVGLVWINSTVTNGVVIGLQTGQGTSISAMVRPGAAVKAPIYKSWNPTLILFNAVSALSDYAYLQGLTDFYRTNLPSADVVLCSTYGLPLPPNGAAICSEADNIADVAVMQADAYTNGFLFFDGHGLMLDNASFAARGLVLGALQPHASNAGYEFYNSLLWSFLALPEDHARASAIGGTLYTTNASSLDGRWATNTYSTPITVTATVDLSTSTSTFCTEQLRIPGAVTNTIFIYSPSGFNYGREVLTGVVPSGAGHLFTNTDFNVGVAVANLSTNGVQIYVH
ncbi:MAG: hypothetical protein KGL39_21305 [Patescibacteria group bacterium]|nr:hypothetical protein [Patescibacteria group bacterium]